jgi:hypothetical protein
MLTVRVRRRTRISVPVFFIKNATRILLRNRNVLLATTAFFKRALEGTAAIFLNTVGRKGNPTESKFV